MAVIICYSHHRKAHTHRARQVTLLHAGAGSAPRHSIAMCFLLLLFPFLFMTGTEGKKKKKKGQGTRTCNFGEARHDDGIHLGGRKMHQNIFCLIEVWDEDDDSGQSDTNPWETCRECTKTQWQFDDKRKICRRILTTTSLTFSTGRRSHSGDERSEPIL